MRTLLLNVAFLTSAGTAFAQDIKLPEPDMKQHSVSVVEALQTRHSVRNFDKTKDLTPQQISTLCWAACGVARDTEHRTALLPETLRRYDFSHSPRPLSMSMMLRQTLS